jgi:hypothetical protein
LGDIKISEDEFIQLSNIFGALGIIEKGIERIYHHLLENRRIDNLKKVCDEYGLKHKRGYKIISALNDLGLVQIYDRPMKINLATPLLSIWQRIINERIEVLQNELQEKKQRLEITLESFINTYQIEQEIPEEPIEFMNFNYNSIGEMYYPFLAKSECKIAIGIRYENPLISYIQEKTINQLPEPMKKSLINSMDKIKENLINLNIQAIFNNELVKELTNSKEFSILTEYLSGLDLKFKKIDVHITEDFFSNFSLTDSELIQPSFDPSNKLMGSYISRNENIYHVFYDKFTEIFERSIPINQFLTQKEELSFESLSDVQSFVLCLL